MERELEIKALKEIAELTKERTKFINFYNEKLGFIIDKIQNNNEDNKKTSMHYNDKSVSKEIMEREIDNQLEKNAEIVGLFEELIFLNNENISQTREKVKQLLISYSDIDEDCFVESHISALLQDLSDAEKNTSTINNLNTYKDIYETYQQRKASMPNYKKAGCYVATCVYGSYDCPEVWVLRRFRDFTLSKNIFGRTFIRTYYAVSPKIVELFGDNKTFKKIFKPILDKMVKDLIEKGYEYTKYVD